MDSVVDTSKENSSARYKYQRLRDRLRQAVKSGELSGKLPGERELAKRYDANAKTINKALCDLTSEGLLIRHVGRGTFVADAASPGGASRRKLMTYAWICSADVAAADHAATHRFIDAFVRQKGHRLVSVAARSDNGGRILDTGISPGQLRSWDGILLAGQPSDTLLADLHRRHLPTVMVQNSHCRIRSSMVLPDYAQGAFELTEFLARLGHERIQLLVDAQLLPAARSAEAGYRAAVIRHGLVPHDAREVDEGFAWSGVLNGDQRPTALVCVGEQVVTRASQEAIRAGLTVPGSLSVTVIVEPGKTDAANRFTRYEVKAQDLAHWAVELLAGASPGQLPRTVIVPGQFIDHGTAAAGPAARSRPCCSPQPCSL